MGRSSLASTRSIISFQVRMQSRSKTVPHGTGVISNFKSMYHDEGVTGLWRGVVPTAQRAAVVAGVDRGRHRRPCWCGGQVVTSTPSCWLRRWNYVSQRIAEVSFLRCRGWRRMPCCWRHVCCSWCPAARRRASS